ncbi:transmembrane protein 14 homolog [Anopheles funestus]|uniref:Transmembrane protein 14C n=2 Tax=Myzomyia TaxID=59140 RepID=A0A182RIG1_ANOFN|nr:transmembrane protein 14 homolog [Anopheles funestus]
MPVDILGFAYAATVAAGGIVGYAKAGSVPSLAAGLTFGALLGYGAMLSSNEPPRPLLQIGTALVLAGMMGSRWARSGKFMPPGLICVISCAMLARGLIYHNRYLPMIGAKHE